MAHNRAQLNDLIFHNRVVLPLTSPGYGEMTLAMAELQGGNHLKAATYAEAAVMRDPALAAGWLAKTAVDVFEATPDDLRKDRALFCMDRALECAPSCRAEIIEFFVANILGHYVEVLGAGALAELSRWRQREAAAGDLESQVMGLYGQAAQLSGGAVLLEAAGLVTGMVALFSRRLGTQVFSGAASVTAFSQAARQTRDAALLDAMGSRLQAGAETLREAGHAHRVASMLYLVPARDLIGVAAQLLRAEGLPRTALDRLVAAFTDHFRQVLGAHLQWLSGVLAKPITQAIEGKAQALAATYQEHGGWIIEAKDHGLYEEPHPASRGTLLWLEHMRPAVRKLEAYALLATPLPFIGKQIFNVRKSSWSRSLAQQIDSAGSMGQKGAGCLLIVTLACLFLVPPAALATGLLWLVLVVNRRGQRRAGAQIKALLASLWSVDTWLSASWALTLQGKEEIEVVVTASQVPRLPTGETRRLTTGTKVLGIVALLLAWLVVLGSFRPVAGPAAKPPNTGASSTPSTKQNMTKATPVEDRQAIVVPTPMPAASVQPEPRHGASSVADSYAVFGVADHDTLNVRAGPGTNHPVTATLSNGTAHVSVVGPSVMNGSTEWVPIKVGDCTGWVTRQHIQREPLPR